MEGMPAIPDLAYYDNFLFPADLEEVRRHALACGFGTWAPEASSVLGVDSFKGVGYTGRHDIILKALAGRTGLQIFPREMKFRVTGKETGASYVHSDRSSGDYTAIVYLSEEDEFSGTGFYRYRPNEIWKQGLTHMPCYSTMIDPVSGEKTVSGKRLQDDMKDARPDDARFWQQTDFVAGLLNRCVVFRSDAFHARLPINGTGESEENMRMVWVVHFCL